MKGKKMQSSCDTCNNYVYDEDYECYTCEMDLDEDEMARVMQHGASECRYYKLYDEYMMVRKQN